MSETVKCRYPNCSHGGIINKSSDKFVIIGKTSYYHEDCYRQKESKAKKENKTKEDLKKFRELWIANINRDVVYWQLNKMLNGFIDRGISSERLLFTLTYVIEHKFKLNYPAGFHYYVDNNEIKNAFLKKKREEELRKNDATTKATTNVQAPNDNQKFNVPKRKTIADLFL